jgi:hypothetical protein
VTDDYIYAGTSGGGGGALYISPVLSPKFTSYSQADGLSQLGVTSSYVTSKYIYAGTPDGLYIAPVSDPTHFTAYTLANGLGGSIVNSVFVTSETIYVGTNGGLSVASVNNPSRFVNYTVVNGLGSNHVNSVYVYNGHVCAGTNGGLSIASVTSTMSFVNTAVGEVLSLFSDPANLFAGLLNDGLANSSPLAPGSIKGTSTLGFNSGQKVNVSSIHGSKSMTYVAAEVIGVENGVFASPVGGSFRQIATFPGAINSLFATGP